MSMKSVLTAPAAAVAFIATVLLAPLPLQAQARTPLQLPEEQLIAKARGIHDRVMTLDTHVDISPQQRTPAHYTERYLNQVNLPKMQEGGLDAVFFSIYVGQTSGDSAFTPAAYKRVYDQAIEKILWVYALTQGVAPNIIGLARTSSEARQIYASGRKVAFMGVENAYSVGEDLTNIKKFADLGVRYMSLSHNGHSQFSDANNGEVIGFKWNGLSPLGREAVVEMNKWGIMIDFSHVSKAAAMEILRLTKAPVMGSHSGVRAVCNHMRNADDEQLRAIKANGGVIQTVALGSFVKCDPEGAAARTAALAALNAEFGITGGGRGAGGGGGGGGRGGARGGGARGGGAAGAGAGGAAGAAAGAAASAAGAAAAASQAVTVESLPPARRAEYDRKLADINTRMPAPGPATVSDFVDHIDHVVNVIGVDHVGISSDFDGGGGIIGWQDASETFNVTLELVRRGYTEAEIEKIWNGNLLRVLDEVQRIAKILQAEGN